jgi:hypothetical protein
MVTWVIFMGFTRENGEIHQGNLDFFFGSKNGDFPNKHGDFPTETKETWDFWKLG